MVPEAGLGTCETRSREDPYSARVPTLPLSGLGLRHSTGIASISGPRYSDFRRLFRDRPACRAINPEARDRSNARKRGEDWGCGLPSRGLGRPFLQILKSKPEALRANSGRSN